MSDGELLSVKTCFTGYNAEERCRDGRTAEDRRRGKEYRVVSVLSKAFNQSVDVSP